jgi:hypothetical protein
MASLDKQKKFSATLFVTMCDQDDPLNVNINKFIQMTFIVHTTLSTWLKACIPHVLTVFGVTATEG